MINRSKFIVALKLALADAEDFSIALKYRLYPTRALTALLTRLLLVSAKPFLQQDDIADALNAIFRSFDIPWQHPSLKRLVCVMEEDSESHYSMAYLTALAPLYTAKILNVDTLCALHLYRDAPEVRNRILHKLTDAALIHEDIIHTVFNDGLTFRTDIDSNVDGHMNEIMADVLILFHRAGYLTEENRKLLVKHPALALNAHQFFQQLEGFNLLTHSVRAHLCQNILHIDAIIDLFHAVTETSVNVFHSEAIVIAICEHLQYEHQIRHCISPMQNADILTPDNFIRLCELATQSNGTLLSFQQILFSSEPDKNLFTFDNLTQLPRLFPFAQAALLALDSLKFAGTLSQSVLNDLFATPQAALFIAEKAKGKPNREEPSLNGFIATTALHHVLSRYKREKPHKNPGAFSFFQLPTEIGRKITQHVIEPTDLDPVSRDYAIDACCLSNLHTPPKR